jgi:hypothetical protein
MPYNDSVRAAWAPLRSLAFGSIAAGYAGVGTSITTPVRIVHILNTTDASLTFSWDGITDHFVLPAAGYMVIDLTTNQVGGGGFFLPGAKRLYVKRLGIPTGGSVYFSLVYSE